MPTDLSKHIDDIAVMDTHEHTLSEQAWDDLKTDVLADLFCNYAPADSISAGASREAAARLMDVSIDPADRWKAVSTAWKAIEFTGYGEGVRLAASHLYGIEQLTPQAMIAAQPKLDALHRSGQRLHLLRDLARLDHVQVDALTLKCAPDTSGPDFFLYDLSWFSLTSGIVAVEDITRETGVTIHDLATLRQAMASLFDRNRKLAIAVKTQHAYERTLAWRARSDADAQRALQAVLSAGKDADVEQKLCIGDWCLARGVELAGECGLPVKIHTGYQHGNGSLNPDWIRPGNLAPLLRAYPNTRFVLMHIGYPYGSELLAMAKQLPNAWIDLCWAWSIDPHTTMEFLRRCIHAVPLNKVFGFGGDSWWPTSSVAYTIQMRRWLTRALSAEVEAGDLTERQAIDVASRLLRENQKACFDIDGRRRAIAEAASANNRAMLEPQPA